MSVSFSFSLHHCGIVAMLPGVILLSDHGYLAPLLSIRRALAGAKTGAVLQMCSSEVMVQCLNL